jgi:ferredoxin
MKARHAMVIDPEKCNNCGACQKACPAGAIEKQSKHQIHHHDCLVCLKCLESCHQKAIRYQ